MTTENIQATPAPAVSPAAVSESSAVAPTEAKPGLKLEGNSAPPQDEAKQPSTDKKPEHVSRSDYNKVMEDRRKISNQLKELSQKFEGRDKDLQFMDLIRKDPSKLKKIVDIIYENEIAPNKDTSTKDPYADWDEEAALKFKEVDELRKRLDAYENQEKAKEAEGVKHNVSVLKEEFVTLLTNDGFIDAEGLYDETLVNGISEALKLRLQDYCKDPRRATTAQLKQAYLDVKDFLSAFEKRTLKRSVTAPVPPTASRTMAPPSGKPSLSSANDRVNFIVNSIRKA